MAHSDPVKSNAFEVARSDAVRKQILNLDWMNAFASALKLDSAAIANIHQALQQIPTWDLQTNLPEIVQFALDTDGSLVDAMVAWCAAREADRSATTVWQQQIASLLNAASQPIRLRWATYLASYSSVRGIDVEIEDRLLSCLDDGDFELRLAAVKALGRWRSSRATTALQTLCNSGIPPEESAARIALQQIGAPGSESFRAFTSGFQYLDPSDQLKEVATFASTFDSQSVPVILEALINAASRQFSLSDPLLRQKRSANAHLISKLTNILQSIGGEHVAETILGYYSADVGNAKIALLSAAEKVGTSGVPDILVTFLKQGDEAARIFAAKELRNVSSDDSIDALLVALKSDESEEVRRTIAFSLGILHPPKAVPVFMQVILEEDGFLVGDCLDALCDYEGVPQVLSDNTFVTVLIEFLEDRHDRYRCRGRSAELLGRIGGQRATSALRDVSDSTTWDNHPELLRCSIIEGLLSLGGADRIKAHDLALRDGSRTVRRALANFICDHPTIDDEEIVRELLSDHVSVRRSAIEAIAKIAGSEAVEEIVGAIAPDLETLVADVLERLDVDRGIGAISRALGNRFDRAQFETLSILCRRQHAMAIRALVELSKSENADCRVQTMATFRDLRSPVSFQVLTRGFQDQDERVRFGAARGLVSSDDARAYDLIRSKAKHLPRGVDADAYLGGHAPCCFDDCLKLNPRVTVARTKCRSCGRPLFQMTNTHDTSSVKQLILEALKSVPTMSQRDVQLRRKKGRVLLRHKLKGSTVSSFIQRLSECLEQLPTTCGGFQTFTSPLIVAVVVEVAVNRRTKRLVCWRVDEPEQSNIDLIWVSDFVT